MAKITVNMDSLKPKKEWKRHKVKEGHNVFRILPPHGESSNGYPYRKWMVVWGLIDPESNRARPFASSMTSEKTCPISEYVAALQKKAETMKGKMQAQGASEADIKNALKPISKVISDIRPKTVYVYNAIDKAGTVGLLEVKTTAHKKLKALMMEYITEYNQDPTSLNAADDDSGVWFDFIRIGEGFDTEYDVKKSQSKSKVNGQLVFVDDRSALPENVSANYGNLAYDLSSIYQVKSYDQLKEVLMANLKQLTTSCPDALVEGFDNFDGVADIKATDAAATSEVKATAKPVATAVQATKGKAAVNLNLSDDDEDEVEVAPAPKSAKVMVSAAAASGDDDIFALADSILNS